MLTFKEFESLYNKGEKRYVQLSMGKPKMKGALTAMDYPAICALANSDPEMEIGWLIPEGFIIIDIDDRTTADIVFKIIQDRKEKVLVVNTTRGIHIYARSNYNNKTVQNITAIGAECDTIVHCKGNSFITTPFKNPKVNTSKKLIDRKVIYYNGIEELPFWLTPIFNRGNKHDDNFIQFPMVDARNDNYNRHLWRLKKTNLSPTQRAECIRMINTYVAQTPLSESEMEATMLRDSNNEDLPEEQFFTNGTFHHDVMGKYLIEVLKVKKDSKSKQLYFYNEDEGIYVTNDEYIKGVMTQLCPSLKDFQKKEVINFLNTYLELHLTDFNKNPLSIVFSNGILNLRTMKLEPHNPNQLETIKLHVNYNPDAVGPTADEFFNTATCGDAQIIQLLYEAIGYCFLKTPELHKAFLLIGEGRNGKSTFLDIIKNICGMENCTSLDFKDLGEKFRVGMLHSKLVSLSGDISSQPLKDSDLFKRIVGGDEITIERKNAHPFNDTVFSTLMFSANTLPRTPDTTSGFYRRLCIIPFNADLSTVSLVDGMTFKENLMKDLEYIAYKAVQHIYNVLNVTHTFIEPTRVKGMMKEYKVDNSSVLSWIVSKKYTAKELTSKNEEELYSEYVVWCDVNGYKSVRSARFDTEICNEFKLKREDTMFVDK
jgi:putative DNA primase/helicase